MGRRDRWTDRQLYMERQMKKRLHPAWRGIGCIIIVLLGVLGYFFAGWFIGAGLIYFPPAVIRPPFAPFLPPGAFVQVVVAFLFMVFCYAVLTLVYAIAFPTKPGETDAPPPKKGRRRKRRR